MKKITLLILSFVVAAVYFSVFNYSSYADEISSIAPALISNLKVSVEDYGHGNRRISSFGRATISWNTQDAIRSYIEYGEGHSMANPEIRWAFAFADVKTHTDAFGISMDKEYFFRIVTKDVTGVEKKSGIYGLITGSPPPLSFAFDSPESKVACTSDEWSCGDWKQCLLDGTQSRNCVITFDCPFENNIPDTIYTLPKPLTSRSCTPSCIKDSWQCDSWNQCSIEGKQSRECKIVFDCPNVDTVKPDTSQSCTPLCAEDTWRCDDWNKCSLDGKQERICRKTFDCPLIETSAPNSTQSCTPPRPQCTEDKWQCGQWNQCSPDGIQRRSCKKIFECPDDESEIPSTSQFCDAPLKTPLQQNQQVSPNQGQSQGNQNSDDIVGEDNIIKSTVILSCPVDRVGHGFRGSGTVIDSYGSILTNRHVIAGTLGFCKVGFTNNYGDEPIFSEYADVAKVSGDEDMAILKIRNNARRFNYIDIMQSNAGKIQVRKRLYIYGYPAIGGKTLLPTDGIISGIQGNRIITNATIAGGNSGGGAYLLEGSYIGIPSATAQDIEKTGQTTSNSLAFIVSINKIKNWVASNYNQKSSSYAFNYSINKSIDTEGIDYENLEPLIVKPGNVIVFADKMKKIKLKNTATAIQTSPQPSFQITNIGDDIVGNYVYFGADPKADPAIKGKLIKNGLFTPPSIKQKAIYYFIFKAKHRGGLTSVASVVRYRYKK